MPSEQKSTAELALSPGASVWALLEALRPKQWTKNVFVLAAWIFAGRLFDPVATGRTFAAVLIFCAVASAVYLVNDVFDREQDRLHPKKRLRPIASGRVSVPAALVAAGVLCLAALYGAFLLSPATLAMVGCYLAISAGYNFGLKRQFILDAMIVAAGFVLRATTGAAAIGAEISPWLLCCTFLLALYLALGKRRHELALLGEGARGHRDALAHYSLPMLDSWLTALGGATIVCYALYTQAPRTVEHFATTELIYTLPFVIYGLFRYQHLVVREGVGGDPGSVVLRDRGLLVTIIGYALAAAVIIYRSRWR
jgi:4-hydroxybenzoate polyprenyltransferase